jgi:hypothetical protein
MIVIKDVGFLFSGWIRITYRDALKKLFDTSRSYDPWVLPYFLSTL